MVKHQKILFYCALSKKVFNLIFIFFHFFLFYSIIIIIIFYKCST